MQQLSSIEITLEQKTILDAGSSFSALESSAAYKALTGWIKGFEQQTAREARGVLQSGAGNDAYIRASIRKDTATELREMIESAITEIKANAVSVLNELKGEPE